MRTYLILNHAISSFRVTDLWVACRVLAGTGVSQFWAQSEGVTFLVTFDKKEFDKLVKWKMEG